MISSNSGIIVRLQWLIGVCTTSYTVLMPAAYGVVHHYSIMIRLGVVFGGQQGATVRGLVALPLLWLGSQVPRFLWAGRVHWRLPPNWHPWDHSWSCQYVEFCCFKPIESSPCRYKTTIQAISRLDSIYWEIFVLRTKCITLLSRHKVYSILNSSTLILPSNWRGERGCSVAWWWLLRERTRSIILLQSTGVSIYSNNLVCTDYVCSCLVTSAAWEWIDQSCDDCYLKYRFASYQRVTSWSHHWLPLVTRIHFT